MEVCRPKESPSGHNNAMENIESKRELISKGVMGLIVGLALIVAGVWAGRQLHIVWNIWPSTDGVVVRGDVQELLQVPYSRGGMPFHRYTPRIVFRYTANGTAYTTEAPSVYSADTVEKAAAKVVELYAQGTHHPIRYNPQDPHDIRFGTIEFGPLAFSFLLLVFGVVLSIVGLTSLVQGYLRGVQVAPAMEQATSATVLPFPERARLETAAATLICPACGRRVNATEDTCPNCLKAMRAA
jgi:hypothetical protein